MRRISLIVLLVVLFVPCAGAAQAGTELGNLPDVAIVIERLPEDATQCNVTSGGLDAAVRVPLDDSRLGLRDPLKSTDLSYLYVNVVALSQDLGCMAYIGLELKRVVEVKSTGLMEMATVWDGGRILSGPAYNFGERVNTALREHANVFLAEWIKQNPKPEPAP